MGYKTSADGTRLVGRQQLQLGRSAFKRTDDASENLAINGESTSNDLIWNGDDAGWTLEAQGTPETYAAHSGTYGLDSGTRSVGQDTRFDYGSNQDIAGTYDSVSFWLMMKQYNTNSRLDIKWKTSGGGTPGTKLAVDDYVTSMDPDIWQKVTIPIDDFALGEDVAQLELTYAVQGPQQFYFDEFQLNQGGVGPKTFRVQSPSGYVWHVEALTIVVAAADSGWNSDAFANIAGGLANGLLLQHKNIGPSPETYWSINAKDNAELFGQYEVINNVDFAGTDLMIVFALKPNLSSVILVDDDDVLDIQVRDDIDSLNKARAFLHYGVEDIPT
jgi:hypothetical protein